MQNQPYTQTAATVEKAFSRVADVREFKQAFSNPDVAVAIEQNLGSESESGVHYFGRMYIEYIKVLDYLGNLTGPQIKQLEDLYARDVRLHPKMTKAVDKTPIVILRKLHDEGVLKELGHIAREAADLSSPLFAATVERMSDMYILGSDLKQRQIPQGDENPAWAQALAGHASPEGFAPRAHVHFLFSHFIPRAVENYFAGKNITPELSKMLTLKDNFHHVEALAIRLMVAEGKIDPEVVKMWNTPRPHGVNWHSDKQNPSSGVDPKQEIINNHATDIGAENPKGVISNLVNSIGAAIQRMRPHSEGVAIHEEIDLRGFPTQFQGQKLEHVMITRTASTIELTCELQNKELNDPSQSNHYYYRFTLANNGKAREYTIEQEMTIGVDDYNRAILAKAQSTFGYMFLSGLSKKLGINIDHTIEETEAVNGFNLALLLGYDHEDMAYHKI